MQIRDEIVAIRNKLNELMTKMNDMMIKEQVLRDYVLLIEERDNLITEHNKKVKEFELKCPHVWVEYGSWYDGEVEVHDCVCPICGISECFEGRYLEFTEGRKTSDKNLLFGEVKPFVLDSKTFEEIKVVINTLTKEINVE